MFLLEVQVVESKALGENVLEEVAFGDLFPVLELIDEALLINQYIVSHIGWKFFLLYLFMCMSAIEVNQCHTKAESLLNSFEQSICYDIEWAPYLDIKSLFEVIVPSL